MGEAKQTTLSRQPLATNEQVEALFNRVPQWDYQCSIHGGEFCSELLLHERFEDAGVQRTRPVACVVPPSTKTG